MLATFCLSNWLTDLNQAINIAKESEKKIILVFSGSDWCKPCMQLKENVFQTDAFINHTSKDYILVNIDFKRDTVGISKKQLEANNQVAEKYNPDGTFPLIIILDSNGTILKSIDGYKGETASYFIKEYLN